MSYKTPLLLLLAVLVLTALSQSMFLVPQGSVGAVFRFQSPLKLGIAPGLHFKLPFIDDTATLDAAGIVLDSDLLNRGRLKFQSADGRTLEAGYFALWHISNVDLFCKTTGCDENAAARRLNGLIVPKLHDAFAYQNSRVLLASQEGFAEELARKLSADAARFGVQLDQVQLSGVNLSATALEDIYGRMRSAAGAKAAEVRATGAAQAGRIRAQAEAERDHLLSAADAQAKTVRTQGEARAAAISAEAARQEPEFFSYFRNLEAYRRSLAGRTTLVLDQDSPFLKYLKPAAH